MKTKSYHARPFLRAALPALALLAAIPAQSQTYTAVTDPVGFQRVTLPEAAGGTTTRRLLAIPYHRPGVFHSAVTAVGSTTLTLGAAEWAPGQFTTLVHYARLRTGTNAGRFFKILSHTESTLTLDTGAVNLSSLVANGDSAEIFPAHTLGSLFGTGTVLFQTGPNEDSADLVRLNTGNDWKSYFHDGTSWRTPGNGSPQNDAALRPDEAVFIVARGNSPLTFRIAGEVGVKKQQTHVPGSGQALVSMRFPVATTLNALGLQSLSGWTAGGTAATADNVLLWNGAAWDIFYYNAGNWEQVGSFGTTGGNTPVTATTGILINRKAGSSGAGAHLPANPPFTNE